MCGIAGVVGDPSLELAQLERMAGSMTHRGPDGQGIWLDDGAGMAFRRLAIIDLHERSNQPLHLGPYSLVFNGEIYNYRELRDELREDGDVFETEGDGEVLLHAWARWGEASLERLNGMFAFGVWDAERRSLTLARDRFGEKPLYYRNDGGRLAFGSDVRALAVLPWVAADADPDAIGPYLARGVMPEPGASFFAGIARVPGAHLLRWREGKVEIARYWTPGRAHVPDSYEDAVEALRELLLDSIRLRLRSDVPVGTSLSGGVDSSTVVGLSAQLAGDHRRHAFTARFPGFARDEWSYAHESAQAAGVVEHHAVEPTADELLDDLEALISSQEEPVNSSSVYAQWRVMRAAREAGVTVLLDGQGGDELFGGYLTMGGYAARSRGLGSTLRGLITDGEVRRTLAVDHLPRAVARRYRSRIASPYADAALVASASRLEPPYEPWMNGDPLRRELLLQSFATSLPELLRYADRSSMAHGREVRLPFLDRRIAEFALSAPPGFLHARGESKRILRDAARSVVPSQVLARREKIGFETPQGSWLQEPSFRGRIAEVLLDPEARARGLYDSEAVEADVRGGSWRDPAALWRPLNLELWLRSVATEAASAARPAGAVPSGPH